MKTLVVLSLLVVSSTNVHGETVPGKSSAADGDQPPSPQDSKHPIQPLDSNHEATGVITNLKNNQKESWPTDPEYLNRMGRPFGLHQQFKPNIHGFSSFIQQGPLQPARKLFMHGQDKNPGQESSPAEAILPYKRYLNGPQDFQPNIPSLRSFIPQQPFQGVPKQVPDTDYRKEPLPTSENQRYRFPPGFF